MSLRLIDVRNAVTDDALPSNKSICSESWHLTADWEKGVPSWLHLSSRFRKGWQ
jgi:hypothetical protein